jgi:hypothetical protein
MIARNLTPSTSIVRNTLSEIVALRLLRSAMASDAKAAAALCDGVAADLKAAVGEYIAAAKASRDPKALRASEALQSDLDAMVKEIEALKPKA